MKIIIEVEWPNPMFDMPNCYQVRTRIRDEGRVLGKNDLFSEVLLDYSGDKAHAIKESLAHTAREFLRVLRLVEEKGRI